MDSELARSQMRSEKTRQDRAEVHVTDRDRSGKSDSVFGLQRLLEALRLRRNDLRIAQDETRQDSTA